MIGVAPRPPFEKNIPRENTVEAYAPPVPKWRYPSDGMLVHSGVRVSKTAGVPSLADIGLALSRIPRFGGHCREAWSVLNHTSVCRRLALREQYRASVVLAIVLHDAHEALTGDIPSPLKGAEMKVLQGDLDARIYEAYYPGGYGAAQEWRSFVHHIDLRALYAEALVVGPPAVDADNVFELFRGEPTRAEQAAVRAEVMMKRAWAPDTDWFRFIVTELQTAIKGGQ